MLLIDGMENATNDNDTWQTLAAATARVLGSNKKQNDEAGDDGDAEARREQESKQHRDYVDRRLRDMAAFEALFRNAMKRGG